MNLTAAGASSAPPRRASRLPAVRRYGGYIVAWIVVGVALLACLAPGLFTSADPLTGQITDRLLAPSAQHPFGTDALGRDLFARVVHGTGISLQATVVALLVALVLSSVLGLLAGYLGGRVDEVLMRVVDVLLALPSLLVSLLLVTALGFGQVNIAIAVGVAAVASFSRVLRSEVLKVRARAYVEAARHYGLPWYRVIWTHIFPHARGPLLALLALEFGAAVLSIAALSFLGYGATPPTPEWGALIADGRGNIRTAWWLITLPGVVLVVLVLAVNRIGRFHNESRW